MIRSDVHAVAQLLSGARSALFVTGAGVSADSGLPVYRGVGGLYDRGLVEQGMSIEEALSGRVFRDHPALTWKYLLQLEEACRGARPNAAHQAIATLEHRLGRVWVLTQNVDGFHRMAGSSQVIDIHGSLRRLHCTLCDWSEEVDGYAHLQSMPPACPCCGHVVRPAVVLFGERLPEEALATLDRELRRGFDVVLSVGTSSSFPYIAEPVVRARMSGVPTVEINPGFSSISAIVDHRVKARAAQALPAIVEAM